MVNPTVLTPHVRHPCARAVCLLPNLSELAAHIHAIEVSEMARVIFKRNWLHGVGCLSKYFAANSMVLLPHVQQPSVCAGCIPLD